MEKIRLTLMGCLAVSLFSGGTMLDRYYEYVRYPVFNYNDGGDRIILSNQGLGDEGDLPGDEGFNNNDFGDEGFGDDVGRDEEFDNGYGFGDEDRFRGPERFGREEFPPENEGLRSPGQFDGRGPEGEEGLNEGEGPERR